MAMTSNAPADTTMMRIVHDALRRDLERATAALTDPGVAAAQRRAIGAHLGWMMRFLHAHHASEDDDIRAEFVERMTAAVGHELSGDNLGGFPWAPVSLLATPGTTDRIVEVLDWVTATADASGEGTSR